MDWGKWSLTCRMLRAYSIGAPIGAGQRSRQIHYHSLIIIIIIRAWPGDHGARYHCKTMTLSVAEGRLWSQLQQPWAPTGLHIYRPAVMAQTPWLGGPRFICSGLIRRTCDPQLRTYCRLSPRSHSHNFPVARIGQGTFDRPGNWTRDLSHDKRALYHWASLTWSLKIGWLFQFVWYFDMKSF